MIDLTDGKHKSIGFQMISQQTMNTHDSFVLTWMLEFNCFYQVNYSMNENEDEFRFSYVYWDGEQGLLDPWINDWMTWQTSVLVL